MQKVEEFFQRLVTDSKSGKGVGICSVCSSNVLVIEAALEESARTGRTVLIEATANQVNQDGGYTGMTPAQFRSWVLTLAGRAGLDYSHIILGGDHLGPLTWSSLPADEAMSHAEALVKSYAAAGFQKLHIDCSMRLSGDDCRRPLSVETVAERSLRLISAAEESSPIRPVYVIGSEVPIPGGARGKEDAPEPTGGAALRAEYEAFKAGFESAGLSSIWNRVTAIVAQPGVEFGDSQVFIYDRAKAAQLIDAARSLPGIVLEGHSTDYQPAESLQRMREDGIAILKVGPALTFTLRRSLFALEEIERIVYDSPPDIGYSNFSSVLEREMIGNPSNWVGHYHGDSHNLSIMRRYSLSDRCRYYLDRPAVQDAARRLFANINSARVPYGLYYQFVPEIAEDIVSGRLDSRAETIVKEEIRRILRNYG